MLVTSLEGKVVIGANTIGYLMKWSLNIKIASGDVTALGDQWKSEVQLLSSWAGSIEFESNPTDAAQLAIQTALISATPNASVPVIEFFEDNVQYFTGAILITDWVPTKTLNAVDKITVSFNGVGPLAHHNS